MSKVTRSPKAPVNNKRGMTLLLATAGSDSSPSLVAQAFARLRSDILRAVLAPGTRLRIGALQDRYGLSSSPLREALNRLASAGLVEIEDWRGFRVSDVSVSELRDITRARVLLEKETLKLAMTHGDDDWETEILTTFHSMQLAQARLSGTELILDETWSQRHRTFHHALRAGCGSPIFLELCDAYFLQTERYRHLSAALREHTKPVGASHQQLMDAVLSRRKSHALDLITEHVQETAKRVIEALTSSPLVRDDGLTPSAKKQRASSQQKQ